MVEDLRQGALYGALLAFWLVLAGEHLLDDVERNRVVAYWPQLLIVAGGSLFALAFELVERHVLSPPLLSSFSSLVSCFSSLVTLRYASIRSAAPTAFPFHSGQRTLRSTNRMARPFAKSDTDCTQPFFLPSPPLRSRHTRRFIMYEYCTVI